MPAPPILYHYTDAAGLKGIVDDVGRSSFPGIYQAPQYSQYDFAKVIRFQASDVRFMNDRDELRAAGRVFAELIDQSVDPGAAHEHRGRQILARLSKELHDNGFLPDPAQVFAVCLSTQPDDLSQWRGYAGGTGGFAIGIPYAALAAYTYPLFAFPEPMDPALGLPPTAELIKVSYDLADIETQAASFIRSYEGAEERSPNDVDLARFGLAKLLPRFKGPGFSGENEWRAITHFAPRGPVPLVGEVRAGRLGLMPYTAFAVNLHAGFHDHRAIRPDRTIEHLIVGPGPHQDLQITAARQLLGMNGHDPSVVEPSEVTFRG